MPYTDPIKVFNFAIEINGINQLLIQEVQKPSVSVQAAEHGDYNSTIKTPGGVEVGDAELKMVKPAPEGDISVWAWLNLAQDMNTKSGGLSGEYSKDIIFKELSPRGIAVSIWLWEGCWVKEISEDNYVRGNQSDNVIQTVTLSVNKVKRIK